MQLCYSAADVCKVLICSHDVSGEKHDSNIVIDVTKEYIQQAAALITTQKLAVQDHPDASNPTTKSEVYIKNSNHSFYISWILIPELETQDFVLQPHLLVMNGRCNLHITGMRTKRFEGSGFIIY